MKMMSKVLKILAVSWIALAVTASGVSGMVLCFDADGHFAFKMARQSHCEDTDSDSAHSPDGVFELAASAGAECYGCCVDVPLSSDTLPQPLFHATHSLSLADALARVCAAASCSIDTGVDIAWSAPCAQRSAPVRISPFLLTLQTIVLRI